MKLLLIFSILIIGKTLPNSYGQVILETNNKNHYDDLTAKKEITRLYRKLRAGYPFDKLAQAYSQDYGSYTIGGNLGWQKPNQFVAGFSHMINQLDKAELSKPFKTEFGYHIVQLLDQKDGEVLTRHILLKVKS
jgi:peptidyl-prolyl cis-trans isomerase SurA